MKKGILTLLSLILIVAVVISFNVLGLFEKKTVYAVGDLTVIWQTDPLFNESNILPGFSQTKTVNVANGAPTQRPIGARGDLTSDPGNMDSVLNIEIKEGATVLYSNTLENFFLDSAGPDGIPLSTLGSGANTTYDFTVTFDEASGNEFQNQTIIFDLTIGISFVLPTTCENINFPNPPIFGTAGNDNISGTVRNDLIITFEGVDRISSGVGNDCIVTSGGGNDKVTTGVGNDVVVTTDGDDDINSGVGNDTIDAGNGNNKVNAGVGNDKVTTGSGSDDIHLGVGNDSASAGGGNDKVVGGTGNDIVDGEEGDDDLAGGVGNDNLVGGLGVDKVNGNIGIDTCDAESETNCEI
ncbi:MAG: hypothetical protein A2629_00290 [Candidatus Levybacteria bacterium RIFCSPHIGHO2_01_FULL_41_15]|nr:MAG: hypothetical protein A2629_00290 [Candidatus Levybacteria bacterium RIFCSPHIGHO2_01_FULL_41_15]